MANHRSSVQLPDDLNYRQRERIEQIEHMAWSGGGNGVTSMKDAADEDIRRYLRSEGYEEVASVQWKKTRK